MGAPQNTAELSPVEAARLDPLFGQILDTDGHIYMPVDILQELTDGISHNGSLDFYKRYVQSEEYREGVSRNRVDLFDVKGMAALGATGLNALSTTDLAALSTTQLEGLGATQLGGLSTSGLGALSATQLQGLTTSQLLGLSTAQAGALSTTQVGALTTTQVGGLTGTQLNALGSTNVAALSVTQVAGLTATQLAGLGTSAAAALSTTQMGSLSTTQVAALGAFPVPVEVIPMAAQRLVRQFAAKGGEAALRLKDGAPLVTDNGQHILDVRGLRITDPLAFESEVNQWPGVVTVGVFAHQKAQVCLLATAEGVQTLTYA